MYEKQIRQIRQICNSCSGSGEGCREWLTCSSCRGHGVTTIVVEGYPCHRCGELGDGSLRDESGYWCDECEREENRR